MNVKNKVAIILTTTCLVFSFSGCSNKKILKADTPVNSGMLTKMAIDSENYDRFNELFSKERSGSISKEDFSKLKKLTTEGTDYKNYELLTFSNGQMFLIRLTTEKINGEYKIDDVIIVPDEMKKFFKDSK